MSAEAIQSKAGRPPLNIDLGVVRELLPQHRNSIMRVAKVLGVHRNTLYCHLNNPAIAIHRRFYAQRAQERENARLALLQEREDARLERKRRIEAERQAKLQPKLNAGIGRIYCSDPSGKLRACATCSTIKPLTDFYFKRDALVYRRICKECCRQSSLLIWHERGAASRIIHGRRRRRVTKLTECYPYLLNASVDGADLLTQINKLVPRNIPETVRADVCQSLALAVLSGEIEIENLAAHIKQHAKSQYKFLPSKHDVSLDAPLFDGHTYSLIDTISTDGYNNAYGVRNCYDNALADCDDSGDLAERLRGAWDANRLKTPQRRTYDRFSASHEDDNRSTVATGQISGRAGMYVKVRRWRPIQASRKGVEKMLDELAYSKEDYLDQRIADEQAALNNPVEVNTASQSDVP